MLTLSPGRMGGSETYARALTAALRQVGTEDYLVAVPDSARDAASGLPSVRVTGVTDSGRVRAFASAATRADVLRQARPFSGSTRTKREEPLLSRVAKIAVYTSDRSPFCSA